MRLRRLKNIGLLGLFPLFEFAVARFVLHSILKVHVGWGWFISDYDFLVPSLVGVSVGLFFLEKEDAHLFKFDARKLFFNLGALTFFFFVSLSSLGSFLWWVTLSLTALSSVLIFVPSAFYFRNKNRIVLPFCALIALSQVIYQHSFSIVYPFLFPKTAALSCETLQSIFGPLRCGFDGPEYYHLEHPAFRIVLGVGCGGFDGIYYFIFAAGLFFLFHRKSLLSWEAPLLLGAGILSMFFLNVIRIILLFSLGFALVHFMSPRTAYPIVMGVFHLNLGWVLYSLFLGFFFRKASLFLTARNRGLGVSYRYV